MVDACFITCDDVVGVLALHPPLRFSSIKQNQFTLVSFWFSVTECGTQYGLLLVRQKWFWTKVCAAVDSIFRVLSISQNMICGSSLLIILIWSRFSWITIVAELPEQVISSTDCRSLENQFHLWLLEGKASPKARKKEEWYSSQTLFIIIKNHQAKIVARHTHFEQCLTQHCLCFLPAKWLNHRWKKLRVHVHRSRNKQLFFQMKTFPLS